MSERSELAVRLVELDLAIEDRESWATRGEDVAELQRLEALRDEVQAALADHRVSRHLRRLLAEPDSSAGVSPATVDPRD